MTARLAPIHGPHRAEALRPIPWAHLGDRDMLLVIFKQRTDQPKGTDTP